MKIDNLYKTRFQLWWVIFYYENEKKLILYSKSPDLQKKISHFVTLLVKEPSFKFIFGNYCSQCGNCCKRENIFVSGGDLFPIALHLGKSEEELYSTYFKNSETWSFHDGYIKLKNGKCPFLEEKSSGRYFCKIYEVRPSSCYLYMPVTDLCRKETPDLIEQIEYIDIENDRASISLKNGMIYEKQIMTENLTEVYNEILSTIYHIDKKDTYNVNNVLEEFREDEREKEKINNSAEETEQKNPIPEADLIDITENREKKFSEEIISPVNGDYLFKINDFEMKEITFYQSMIYLSYYTGEKQYNNYMNYSEDSGIIEKAGELIKDLCNHIKENYNDYITDKNPVCYMCGTCCSKFTIDISPSDIKKLAEGLNISTEEVIKKYVNEKHYSWNPGGGTLKKEIIDETEEKRCLLLKKENDEKFYCSVHSFKPCICKSYQPGKDVCYKSIKDSDYYRILNKFHSFHLTNEELTVTTSIYTDNKMPFRIKWKETENLKKSIYNFLMAFREYMIKTYYPGCG